MRPWTRSAVVLLLILLVATVFFALLYRPPQQTSLPQPPRAHYAVQCGPQGVDPARIVVSQYTVVVLDVTAQEETYTFNILAYGLSTRVGPGETVQVGPFQATRLGAFAYTCTASTSVDAALQGTLEVVPPAS